MADEKWRLWEQDKEYGDLFYKRAIGDIEEMESSKALCQYLSRFYQQGMKVVDVGCGAGHYLRSLRERVDERIDYTGIDATDYYVSLAQKAFPENARFQVGDIFNLPLEDDAYDIVVNANVLLHLPPPPLKPLQELIRVSKKYVIIRTLFGERNYIVKEMKKDELLKNAEQAVVSDGDDAEFAYYNMYTERYFRELIHSIAPQVSIEIVKDDMWQAFDNRELTTKTGTRVIGQNQISGNLLLDWRFLVLTKHADSLAR